MQFGKKSITKQETGHQNEPEAGDASQNAPRIGEKKSTRVITNSNAMETSHWQEFTHVSSGTDNAQEQHSQSNSQRRAGERRRGENKLNNREG